jgi:hypothetical protein
MVIIKATSFLEGHNRDMGMTFRITHLAIMQPWLTCFQR